MSRALIHDGTKWIASSAFQPRQVKVTRTVVQPISNALLTSIAWDAETYDLPNNDQHTNTAPNNTRLTCVEAGLYVAAFHTYWPVSNTGERYSEIALNGAGVAVDRRQALSRSEASVTVQLRLAVGNYLEARVYQTAGAALDFDGVYGFSWVRIGA
jgi:hypothetical protein